MPVSTSSVGTQGTTTFACVYINVCVCVSPECCVDLSAPSLSLPVGTWRAVWWLGAGSCWHDRPVQRDGAGDAGGEQTERPLYSPWPSLGKLCSPRLRLWLQAGRQVDLQVLHSAAPAPWYARICDLLKKKTEQYPVYFNESRGLMDGTECSVGDCVKISQVGLSERNNHSIYQSPKWCCSFLWEAGKAWPLTFIHARQYEQPGRLLDILVFASDR